MSDPRALKAQETFNPEQLKILQNYRSTLQKLLDNQSFQLNNLYISESPDVERTLYKIIGEEIKRIDTLVQQWKPMWTQHTTVPGSITPTSSIRANSNSDYYRLLRDALKLGLHRQLDEADRHLQSPRSIFESENNLDKTVATLLEIVRSPEHIKMRELNVYKLIRADVKQNHTDLDFALQLNHRISQAKTTSHYDEQVKLMNKIEAIACDDTLKQNRAISHQRMKPADLNELINAEKLQEYIKAMIQTYATVEKKSKVFTSELVKTLKTILVANEQSAKVFSGFTEIQTQAKNYSSKMIDDIKKVLEELFSTGKDPTGVSDIKKILKKNDLSQVEMLANITKIAMQRLDIDDKNREPKTNNFYRAIISGETSQLVALINPEKATQKKS